MSDSVRSHRRRPTRLPRPWDSPGKNTGVGCHFLLQCRKVKSEREVAQSCPTLRDPMDCCPPGPSVHGIFQARVLEWGAIAFSKIYTTLLILWEMQIKTTVRYSLMPLEWLLSKRQELIHFGEDVDRRKPSLLVRMKIGAVNVKIVWSFLKKRLELSCGPVIPLLGI